MDSFRRERGQSDSAADSFYQQYSPGPSQQRLPPFRTLLSENGSNESAKLASKISNGCQSPPTVMPGYVPVASSSQPRPAPMPSIARGFDDFSAQYAEPAAYSQMQSPRGADYLLGANRVSQYPEVPTPYSGHPLTGQHFQPYQAGPSLPSIREMSDRRERLMASNGNNGSGPVSSYPNENLAQFPVPGFDAEHGGYGPRRPVLYDSTYAAPGSGHVSPASDYSRYGQATYEPPGRGYSSIYGDADYPSQPTNGPQQPNFSVLGDSNDLRNKRRRGNLPKHVTDILRAWFHDHLDHPYPTEEDKQMFISKTNLSISQISNWFINARRRQLPSLRNQVRSQEHGRSSHPHVLNEQEQFSSQESSLSPRQ